MLLRLFCESEDGLGLSIVVFSISNGTLILEGPFFPDDFSIVVGIHV
jgi:hypothetical protein